MDKRRAFSPSDSTFQWLTVEISQGGQCVLPEVQAPHSPQRQHLQGRESPGYGVGEQASGEEEAWVRGAEISRTETYGEDHEEVNSKTEMSNLQLYH